MTKTCEIMGFYKLEPGKYMKPKGAKTCPFKKNKSWLNRFCERNDCALWDSEKQKCGMLVK